MLEKKDSIIKLYEEKQYALVVHMLVQAHDVGHFQMSSYDLNRLCNKISGADKLSIEEYNKTKLIIKELIMSEVDANKHTNKKPRVFIVHGWDDNLRMETELYLNKIMNMECIILFEKDSEGLTIIEKFEKYSNEADVAIVLLSDQDESSNQIKDPNSVRRPRPNVLFEMGFFFAKLGRRRTVIFKKGNVEIHSDVYGIEYIDVSNGVESQSENIKRRLEFL